MFRSDRIGAKISEPVKQSVIVIKRLAKEFARQRGDDDILDQIERAIDAERRTVEKRFSKTTPESNAGF